MEIDIEAPPSTVWRVFADFPSWDAWTSGFMRFLEPPTAVGKRCGLVCKLSQGALKTTTHWPMVRRQARSAAGCVSNQALVLSRTWPRTPRHHWLLPVALATKQVEVFDEGRELMWRDFSLLISPFWQGCHWFRFEALPGGRTRLLHGTRQMGLAMPALWDAMKSTELGYNAFNEELQAEVARRFPSGAACAAHTAAAAVAVAAPRRPGAGALVLAPMPHSSAAGAGKLLACDGGVETRAMAAMRQAGGTLIAAVNTAQ